MKYLNICNFENYARFLKVKHKINKTLFNFSPETWYPAQKVLHQKIEKSLEEKRLPWFLVLKARQEGVSTYSEARIFHLTATNPNTDGLVLADTRERAEYIFNMCKTFYDYLPEILRPELRYSTRKELTFDTVEGQGLKSSIRIATAFDPYVGQSMCLRAVHVSEAASFPYLNQVFTTLIPSVPHSMDTLVMIESTAKGAGAEFHQEWLQAKAGRSIFQPIFIPWYLMPEYSLNPQFPEYEYFKPHSLTEHEEALKRVALEEYGHNITEGQFAWRRFMIEKSFRGDEDGFNQEMPSSDSEAFIVAGDTAFNKQRLKEAYDKRIPPKRRAKVQYTILDYEIRGAVVDDPQGKLWIWKEPEPHKIYRIGVDPAGGEGGDYTAMQVIDEVDKEQVAELQDYIDPIETAHVAVALARYYNDAKLAIEINFGLGCQIEAKRYYWNFYRHKYLDRISDKPTEKIGFLTTPTFKKELIAYGQYVFNRGLYKIYSERLLGELFTFVKRPGMELASAAAGTHDDLVVSFLIAVYTSYQDMDYAGYTQQKEKVSELEILSTLGAYGVDTTSALFYSKKQEPDTWMDL